MKPSSALLVAAASIALAGCEWFSTMSDPASIEPHERQPLLAAENAVPLGGQSAFDLTNADERLSNTRPSSPQSLEIGRAHYDTFCAVCHGRTGLGDGPLAQPFPAGPGGQPPTPKFPAIPAIATEKVAGYTDPYIFALISKGRGLMPDYGRIPATARWDIVNYLRTLPPGAGATGAPAAVGADTAGGGAR